MGHVRKHLRTVALLLLTGFILWRLWRGMSWTELRRSFDQANGLLLAAAFVVSSSTNLIRAFRWRALLSPISPAGLSEVYAATNIGIGASFVFGTAVGELIRPSALPLLSPAVRPAASYLTVVIERICDVSVLLILFGLSLLWFPILTGHTAERTYAKEAGIVLLALPFLGTGLVLLLRKRSVLTARITAGLAVWSLAPNRILRAAARTLQHLATALNLLSNERQLAVLASWTSVQWLSVILTNWLVLRAFGLHFGVRQTIVIMSCGLVGSVVPTPGGAAGAFHAALSGGLVLLGVTLERAAAISIAAHLLGYVPALVFGSYYLLRGSVGLAQLQQRMSVAGELSESVGPAPGIEVQHSITLEKLKTPQRQN
jgi:uncharacterized protein (TIRG00374 family)